MNNIKKIKKLINNKSVLLYKSKTEYGTVKGYIQKIDEIGINQVNFIVYYPTKLNNFQIWGVSFDDLLNNSTITDEKVNW
tara:strand:- start:61 stop:300 length:240 start_codon:yes stop_codon:yes gene_type:complete